MKLAAVVILYYPENKTVDNILSYSGHVDTVFVIDNSEKQNEAFNKELKRISNHEYFFDGENKGISRRLTDACQWARDKGFDWLLTMDQDSSFSKGVFEKYLGLCKNYPGEKVAEFGLNYLPELWPVEEKALPVLSTITSGSIVNLAANKIIGGWSEDLFIDLVDAEYCYRAGHLGYQIISFRNIVLNHRIGYIQMGRSLKSFKLTPRVLHNPIRIYYIIRNSLYMLNKYPYTPNEARPELKKTLSLLKNNILYHKKRGLVVKYLIRGYLDYKRNKMGKLAV